MNERQLDEARALVVRHLARALARAYRRKRASGEHEPDEEHDRPRVDVEDRPNGNPVRLGRR
jgi:hypothetical protein